MTSTSPSRSALLVLLAVLLSQELVAASRELHARTLTQDNDDDNDYPSCVDKNDGKTYKPRGSGSWKKKYDGLDKCFEECLGEYDVVVHNEEDDKCYCWDKEDGRWEDADGDDVAYDISSCREERDDDDGADDSADSDRDDGDDDSSNSDRRTRGGDSIWRLPSCVQETSSLRDGVVLRTIPEDECDDECYDEDGVVVARRNGYCWCLNFDRDDDGWGNTDDDGDLIYYNISRCGEIDGSDDDDDDNTEESDSDDDRREDSRSGPDDLPSCIEERPSRTYKPRRGGSWERKLDGINECLIFCFDDYDIIVWNKKDDKCYCWKEEDGQLEESDGDDITYDLRECKDSDDDDRDRSKSDDESSEKESTKESSSGEKSDEKSEDKESSSERESVSEEKSDETNGDDDGPISVTIPMCVVESRQRTFVPRPTPPGYLPRSYGDIETCFRRCFDAYEIIVLRVDEQRCYCYMKADGWWEWPTGNRDVSYDLRTCKSPPTGFGTLGLGGTGGLPGGAPQLSLSSQKNVIIEVSYFRSKRCGQEWGAIASVDGECGTPRWSQEWTIQEGSSCVGTANKTIMPGYLAYFMVNQEAGAPSSARTMKYDGSLDSCKSLFALDHWNLLLNADIDVGSGSWLTWDGQTGACQLYRDSNACTGLRPVGQPGQYVSARFCQPPQVFG